MKTGTYQDATRAWTFSMQISLELSRPNPIGNRAISVFLHFLKAKDINIQFRMGSRGNKFQSLV